MQQIGERKNAHQERAIVTWNGFAALAIGLAAAGGRHLATVARHALTAARRRCRAWLPRYSPLLRCSCSAS